MREITIGEATYQVGKIPTMQQVLMAKKLLPAAGQLVAVAAGNLTAAGLRDKINTDTNLVALIAPVTNALTSMSDDDVESIISTCLACTKRKEGLTYMPLWNAAAKQPQYDIDLDATFMIVAAALQENFGPFIGGLLSRLPAPPPQANAPSPG